MHSNLKMRNKKARPASAKRGVWWAGRLEIEKIIKTKPACSSLLDEVSPFLPHNL